MSENQSQQLNLGKSNSSGQSRNRNVGISRIARSGGAGFLGQLLLKRLLLMPEVTEVHVFDIQTPQFVHSNKLFFHRLDLTKDGADVEMAKVLLDRQVPLFIHAALFMDPGKFSGKRREVESIGTFHVLNAVAEAKVERLFVFSSTFVYGAHPSNPNFLREDAPLQSRGPGYVRTRVDVEKQVQEFSREYPGVQVLALRFAPIFGPSAQSTLARYFLSGVIPKILGFDPLFQFLHEEDAGRAALWALHSSRSGVYNIVGRGVLPLSTGFHICGRIGVPVFPGLVKTTFRLGHLLRIWDISADLVPMFQYICVADGQKASTDLGFVAEYSSRQALKSMVEANRLRRVGFSVPSFGLGEERPESGQRGFERVY
jgi:UDP-glucose 4-epimerase